MKLSKLPLFIFLLACLTISSSFKLLGLKDIPGEINDYTLLIENYEYRNPDDYKGKTLNNCYFNEAGELVYRESSPETAEFDKSFNMEKYIVQTNKRLKKKNDFLQKKFIKYCQRKFVFINSGDIENFSIKTHRFILKRHIDTKATMNAGIIIGECFYIYDRELKKSYRTNNLDRINMLSMIAELNNVKSDPQ